MKSIKVVTIFLLFFAEHNLLAQSTSHIYVDNIKTVLLHFPGNQLSMPVINLNSADQLQLSFDDLDGDTKYYYYTYQLCNSDWTPANIGQFDYIKGFTQDRIKDYKYSSVALTRYTHYTILLPDQNMNLTRSGNYILKVFLNGDTSQLVFTKRLLVLDSKSDINARIVQPFDPNLATTHQRIQFTVTTKGLDQLNAAQQIKVVVLQNRRFDNAVSDLKPNIVRGNKLEYTNENAAIFRGGREWRYVDLTDFHLQSDRVLKADYNRHSIDVYLRDDRPLTGPYIFYNDLNGAYSIQSVRGTNPFWEADYATVYFSFVPPDGIAYKDKDIYLFGQLTSYGLIDSLKMIFNPGKGKYETHLFLKQGYYNYTYMAVDKNNPAVYSELDGSFFETENLYTILVYYKSFGSRADELIGIGNFNSKAEQPLNY
ncbi:MAG TPA: DUF5103 domain-containing protein [Hanamia sp.]